MSSLGSAGTPNYQYAQLDVTRAVESNVTFLYGSFQGFVTSQANYLPAQSRGAWFSVQWTATGVYVVTINLKTGAFAQPYGTVTAGTTTPGNPNGLILEPRVNIVYEGFQPTLTTILNSGTPFNAVASRLDYRPTSANYNQFIVYTYTGVATSPTPADLPTTYRLFFQIAYKNSTYNP